MPALLSSAPGRTPAAPTIDDLVRRAGALYSLPAVGVEVLRLTDGPKVDVRALTQCISNDPALAAKLMRVVNSSVFGLSREVVSLDQAVALLGIKPLKVLVLGFSLPENLFLAAACDQLNWYWTMAATRAVAAREISEQLLKQPGDEAFLAGLLADLGVMALLHELGPRYADLLSEAIAAHVDLNQMEEATLGFSHQQLTASLLDRWQMPTSLVRAIEAPKVVRQWAKNKAEYAPLVRILHMADLMAQLVGQHRLNVLPDLLDAGAAYCDLEKDRLYELVASLEPKVKQLADVLSIDVSQAHQYAHVLRLAHEQLATITEGVAASLGRMSLPPTWSPPVGPVKEDASNAVAAESAIAAERQPATPNGAVTGQASPCASSTHQEIAVPLPANAAAGAAAKRPVIALQFNDASLDEFAVRLTIAVGQSRAQRTPLSTVLVEVKPANDGEARGEAVERLLDAAVRGTELASADFHTPKRGRRLFIVPAADRTEAVASARVVVDRLKTLAKRLTDAGELPECIAAGGVATAPAPAKNFEPQRLLETAERCLLAALPSGTVKSLEVI